MPCAAAPAPTFPPTRCPTTPDESPGPEESAVRIVEAEQARELLSTLPEQQRRGLCTFSERDQQLALLGGPSAPLPEILTTYATALAVGRTPDDVHIYGIDLIGRSLAQLAELPHCGGVAVRNDNLALRMLRWLTQLVAERKAAVPAGRFGSAEEFGAVVAFLCSAHAGYITGQNVLIDGGGYPGSL